MPIKRVIVVGAGVGGLAAALCLAARGIAVVVIERASTPGGKLRQVEVAGQKIDAGPTVFTMRWVFDEIFREAGEDLGAHLTLEPAAIIARHFWNDSESLDLFADEARSIDAIGQFSDAENARGYARFCARSKRIYEILEQPFMKNDTPGILRLIAGIGLHRPLALMSITPYTTLWQELGRYFPDPRLQQLFGRYATYCGSSPFEAPATLMLVAHVERTGVWIVREGMHAIARVMADLALRRGVEIRYDTVVEGILNRQGRAGGVRLGCGEWLESDAVVINADAGAVGAGILGPHVAGAVPKVSTPDRSLSAVTWAMVADTAGAPLVRHNVFFSPDYASEFRAMAQGGGCPPAPTVYICAQDRDGIGQRVTAGPERLLVIVNAPANGDIGPPDTRERERCEAAMFQTLARCGLKGLRPIQGTVMTTPADFEHLFPATGGALYGRASNGWRASFRRSGSRSRMPGLYFAGGSVHPGPGLPMAALSGRMAASRLVADLASTRQSHPMAMAGGISMR